MALVDTQTPIPYFQPTGQYNNDVNQLIDIIIRMKTEFDRIQTELTALDGRI